MAGPRALRRHARRLQRINWRWLPAVVLSIAFLVAGALAATTDDPTWTSIWVGVAATSAAAALVDASAVWETSHRFAPVTSLAARRIGRAHQLLLQIVAVVFDDIQVTAATDWPCALRAAPDVALDLSTPADVYPPRSRQQYLRELHAQLDSVIEELIALSAAGVLTRQTEAVDHALTSSPFVSLVRNVSPVETAWRSRHVIAEQAAAVVGAVQQVMPDAAAVGGRTWRYGNWPHAR